MKISVILAIYNEDQYLQKCLTSLNKQRGVTFEIIIVDDGSYKKVDLNTYKIQNTKYKIQLHRIDHSSPAIARNLGVEKSKGDIVVFVDGDMEFEPDFLQKLTDPIVKGETKGTFSTEEFVANWDNLWARCWNNENGLATKRRIKKSINMVRDFRAILKSEFTRVKGFDNTGYTDTWTLGKKLGYWPTPTNAKYYHYNPASRNEVFMQALWIGARQRKWGLIGSVIAGIRATIVFSLPLAIFKAIRYKQPHMIKFKLIYDLGILGGVMNRIVNKSN